jgi:hypothetical protein
MSVDEASRRGGATERAAIATEARTRRRPESVSRFESLFDRAAQARRELGGADVSDPRVGRDVDEPTSWLGAGPIRSHRDEPRASEAAEAVPTPSWQPAVAVDRACRPGAVEGDAPRMGEGRWTPPHPSEASTGPSEAAPHPTPRQETAGDDPGGALMRFAAAAALRSDVRVECRTPRLGRVVLHPSRAGGILRTVVELDPAFVVSAHAAGLRPNPGVSPASGVPETTAIVSVATSAVAEGPGERSGWHRSTRSEP